MNVEELLRSIPELAPSPDLEARIVRAARPRFRGLLPAAAALLFCVGVVGSVTLTIGGKGKPEGPLIIRFQQEDDRWVVRPADIYTLLPHVKERGVVLAGPDATPWGLVRTVRKACAKAGIERTGWRVADRSLEVQTHGAPPPTGSLLVRLEDIQIILRREPGSDATIRRVGSRKPVTTDDELILLILRMAADYRRAGMTEIPVIIDGGDNIPWGEIVLWMEKCRATGAFARLEVDVPPEPFKFDKTHFGPDQKIFPPLKDN